jgi:hypothetical protein
VRELEPAVLARRGVGDLGQAAPPLVHPEQRHPRARDRGAAVRHHRAAAHRHARLEADVVAQLLSRLDQLGRKHDLAAARHLHPAARVLDGRRVQRARPHAVGAVLSGRVRPDVGATPVAGRVVRSQQHARVRQRCALAVGHAADDRAPGPEHELDVRGLGQDDRPPRRRVSLRLDGHGNGAVGQGGEDEAAVRLRLRVEHEHP